MTLLSKQVLLVDPYIDMIEPFMSLLNYYGYEVEATQSAQGALLIASVRPPGAIVIELDLHDMDGHEVCKKLRALPQMENCRFVVLTANPKFLTKEVEDCFDAVLLKPVQIERLISILEK